VATLLREQGLDVCEAAAEPARGEFDLVLVEQTIAEARPGLADRLGAQFRRARVELLRPLLRPGQLLELLA
jgi:hypothetical protein